MAVALSLLLSFPAVGFGLAPPVVVPPAAPPVARPQAVPVSQLQGKSLETLVGATAGTGPGALEAQNLRGQPPKASEASLGWNAGGESKLEQLLHGSSSASPAMYEEAVKFQFPKAQAQGDAATMDHWKISLGAFFLAVFTATGVVLRWWGRRGGKTSPVMEMTEIATLDNALADQQKFALAAFAGHNMEAEARTNSVARQAEPVTATAAAAAAAKAATAAKAASAAKGAVKVGAAVTGSAGTSTLAEAVDEELADDEELAKKKLMFKDRGTPEYERVVRARTKLNEKQWEVYTARNPDGNFGDAKNAKKEVDMYDPLTSTSDRWLEEAGAQFNPAYQIGATEPLGYFDPLGFCKKGDEYTFRQYRTAEIKHGRVAMMASVGAVAQHYVKFPGFENVPSGLAAVNVAPGTYGAIVLFAVSGFLEMAVWKENKGKAPGNFGDPLGLNSYDEDMRNRELNNGRMAMFAALGIMAAELATGRDASEQFGGKLASAAFAGERMEDFGRQMSRMARQAEPVTATAAAAAAAKAATAAKAASAAKGAVKVGAAVTGSAGTSTLAEAVDEELADDEELAKKKLMFKDRGTPEYERVVRARTKLNEKQWEVYTARNPDGNFGDAKNAKKEVDMYDPLTSTSERWLEEADAQFNPAYQIGATEPLGYFDPLGFCKKGDEYTFRQYRTAEIKHGRVAMMASVGAVAQHYVKFPGFENVPSGLAAVNVAPGTYGAVVLFAVSGFLEMAVWKENKGKAPGNFGDPLGLNSYDEDMRNRELNNGRMAMFAALGIMAAELATGRDAIEQFGLK